MLAEATSSRSEQLWLTSLAIASLAVVVVAVLFGLVIAALQRIDRHAARIHAAAKQIAQNTVALWTLEQVNRDLVAIRDAARVRPRAAAGGDPALLAHLRARGRDGAGAPAPRRGRLGLVVPRQR